MAHNLSLEAYESTMAEELANEAETALERGLTWVTGATLCSVNTQPRRECHEPIEDAVAIALLDDGVMWHLLQVVQTTTPEALVARVNSLRSALAKQIGEDNALGVVEARFAPLVRACEEQS